MLSFANKINCIKIVGYY